MSRFRLLFLLLIVSCSAPTLKNPKILAEGSIGDASRLNPLLATDSASGDIVGQLFNGLVKYDKTLKIVGDLAESFEFSDDCLHATFHLRKGVKWHDGREVTADDIFFTYRKAIDPAVATPYSGDFERVKEVRIIDPYTLRVEYKEPFAPGLPSWGMGILPKHLLEGKDLNADPFNRSPVGTGPFRFVEWVAGQRIFLSAYDGYFDGRPKVDGYLYRIIPDTATMFLELKTLNIDFMGLTPVQYQRQTDTPFFKREFARYTYPARGYTYLGYNLLDPKFSDVRVRRAIGHALDKKGIIAGVLLGLGKPATGPFYPESWAYNHEVTDLEHNPEKAKALLAEAGWKDTDGDGILDKSGIPFTFTILTNQGNEQRAKSAQIIQRGLKGIGMKVEIRILEWQSFLHQFIDKKNFEAIILGWGMGLDPDLYDIWHSSKTKEGEYNFISYKNPRVDELILEGRRSCDQKKREKIYHQVHRLIAEDQPYTFLYYPMALPIVHRRFKGIEPSPLGIAYNIDKWWVPANKAAWYIQQ